MSRFNLLMIGTEPALRPLVVKALGKAFPANFAFEVQGMNEAESLLRKLHIDMIVVDLDAIPSNFQEMDRLYPHTMFVGISRNPRAIDIPMNVYKHRLFSKADFATSISAEFKALRKTAELPVDKARRMKQPQAPGQVEFEDFSVLMAAR